MAGRDADHFAAVVARDVVVVGSSIADNVRAAAPRGTVQAFDARTGRLRLQSRL